MRYPEILAIRSEPISSSYDEKDTILYALGLGMGADQAMSAELTFVYETELRAVPTMAAILASGAGAVLAGGGIDISRMVHGEQRLRIHKPLPPRGSIVSRGHCLSVTDKGAGKGAVLDVESTITDAATDELHCTIVMSFFCRGDGGFGGAQGSELPAHRVPSRAHDMAVALATRPDQALLYRLNGDRNPLHVDPRVAQAAGFDRPILQGLCIYGMACRAVLGAYCDYDPGRIGTFDARFSAPFFPGETLVTHLWQDGPIISFEAIAAERGVRVLTQGRCELVERTSGSD